MIRYQEHANEHVIKFEFKLTRKQDCAKLPKNCLIALRMNISVPHSTDKCSTSIVIILSRVSLFANKNVIVGLQCCELVL